ncbi:MAG: hypothetical protein HDR74_10470 [Bacteroides sp.]|nr:hypothetical protein [Bacteroides sp.]
MKKSLYILSLITLLFSSCVNSSYNKQEEEQNSKSKYPIVGFVEEFVASHPNFDNNNITREQADVDFLQSFTEVSDSVNLLQNIPVKLCALNQNSKGEVMAQFRSWIKPTNFEFPKPVNEVNFDVIGRIDPKYVDSLNDDSYYTLSGTFIGRIESMDVFRVLLGLRTSIYTPSFNVRKDDIWDDQYEVSLGMMYFAIDSIAPFAH